MIKSRSYPLLWPVNARHDERKGLQRRALFHPKLDIRLSLHIIAHHCTLPIIALYPYHCTLPNNDALELTRPLPFTLMTYNDDTLAQSRACEHGYNGDE